MAHVKNKWAIVALLSTCVLGACALALYMSVSRFVSSLGTRTTDLTSDAQAWGGYPPGSIFSTKRPMLYAASRLDDVFYWPINGGAETRVEYGEYLADATKYPGVIQVPAGTRIVVARIEHIDSLNFSALRVFGEFVDGPCPGEPVDFYYLSVNPRDSIAPLWPDPERIELVAAHTSQP